MIGLSFFEHEMRSDIAREITIFANNNLLHMLSFAKDNYLEDDFIDIILPAYYVREHGIDCINRFYELQELLQSPVCRSYIKPLYEYVLYSIIQACIEIENTYLAENGEPLFCFELPAKLKSKIRRELDKYKGDLIIKQVVCVKDYVDFCFWDWDFIDNVEMIAIHAIAHGKNFIDEFLTIDADDYIELMPVDLRNEYLRSNFKNKDNVFSPVKAIRIALSNSILDLERRVTEVENRLETELSNDINMGISSWLAMHNIISTREFQMGRALKALGETDFYFYFQNSDGKVTDIAVLESKILQQFPKQYKQLLGYLNQNFLCGFTLSINKTKPSQDAKKDIVDWINGELKSISAGNFVFETKLYQENCRHPLVAISEHFVPENPKAKMKIFHYLLNLYDKPRKGIAKKARAKPEH